MFLARELQEPLEKRMSDTGPIDFLRGGRRKAGVSRWAHSQSRGSPLPEARSLQYLSVRAPIVADRLEHRSSSGRSRRLPVR